MTDQAPTSDAPPGPNKLLAGLAASLPPLSLLVGCVCAMPLAGGGDMDQVAHTFQEGGVFMFVVLGVSLLVGITNAVLLFLAGIGKRVPAAIAVFLACMPWLCGLAGTSWGMNMVEEAVVFADPSQRASLLAMGLSQSMVTRAFGAALSAASLGAVGVGLGLCALSVRAPGRGFIGAVIGGVLALPLFGAAVVTFPAARGAASVLLIAAVAALIAAVLGGAGVGRDAPKYRGGANGAAGALAAGLGFAAAAVAVTMAVLIEVFGALAHADAASRGEFLLAGIEEMSMLNLVASAGPLLALFPALGVAGWAIARGGVSGGRIAGAVALVLVVAMIGGLDAWTEASAGDSLSAGSEPVWSRIEGFTPVQFEGDTGHGTPHAILGADALHLWNGEPLALGALSEAATRTTAVERLRAAVSGDEPEWGGPGFPPVPDGLEYDSTPNPDPDLVVAVDARTSLATFRALLETAELAGIGSLQIAGGGEVDAEQAQRILDDAPFFAFVGTSESRTTMLLSPSIPAGHADQEEHLLHGTIGAAPSVRVTGRAGVLVTFESNGIERWDAPESGSTVYLNLAPDATVASIAQVTSDLSRAGYQPLVVTGPIPGNPATALGGVLGALDEGNVGSLGALLGGPDGEGTIGLGNLGVLGHGAGIGSGTGGGPRPPPPRTRVRSGNTEVTGTLSREVIRRVIRRHVNEVRFCYEQQLARNPNLGDGRIVIDLIISPTGSVQTATVAETTLNDSAVETCIARAVRRWAFPAPEGGGIVRVRYPFVLNNPG